MGKYGPKQTLKRKLVYNLRADPRRQSITLFDLSWDQMYQATQIFGLFAHTCVQERLQNRQEY